MAGVGKNGCFHGGARKFISLYLFKHRFMRKYSYPLMLLCLVASCGANGQKVAEDYAFTVNYIEIKLYDPFAQVVIVDPTKTYFAMRGDIFTIQASVTMGGVAGYCIVFWPFNSKNEQVKGVAPIRGQTPHVVNATDNSKVFFRSEEHTSELQSL